MLILFQVNKKLILFVEKYGIDYSEFQEIEYDTIFA